MTRSTCGRRKPSRAGTKNPIDLPGRWYLQVIGQLFKENRLARGEFAGLGRRLDLRDITCPLYLLAGEGDDITSPEQVFNAANLVGTPQERIVRQLVPGGHIGLFMGGQDAYGTLAGDRPLDRRAVAGDCKRAETPVRDRYRMAGECCEGTFSRIQASPSRSWASSSR
ncbi:hypothetical protein ACFS3C_13800 [Azotobacter vinelandii]